MNRDVVDSAVAAFRASVVELQKAGDLSGESLKDAAQAAMGSMDLGPHLAERDCAAGGRQDAAVFLANWMLY